MAMQDVGGARNAELAARMEAALAARGPGYRPNTQLLQADGAPRYTNRLIFDASPYLLQHAHNPVDWHPWGPEAMSLAEQRDVPIFLSVGYATCHWCHVMEEESFDNEAVAVRLNENFVPVKLDREARPDLDHAFMIGTQILTGHGGWPNSVFLLPNGKPFFAGSYFPRDRFLQLLAAVTEAWRDPARRTALHKQADGLAQAIVGLGARSERPAALGEEMCQAATQAIGRAHNPVDGGFSRSMQFPQEVWLLFLQDCWRRHGADSARDMVLRSLRAVVAGGIHDHVGGGFHRYTVDVNWRTPHFEKMLYNQALLCRALVDAYGFSGEIGFRRAAERTIRYLARDLTVLEGDAAGAFHAAEDADSLAPSGRREEGFFYVWTPRSVIEALGDEDGQAAVRKFGIDAAPTLENGAVAHLPAESALDPDVMDPLLERMREARDIRPRPRRDDKVIAEWNGMMIRALAEAGLRLPDSSALAMGVSAAEGVRRALWTPEAGFCRFWCDGRAEGRGQLSDYASMGLASLSLFDATRDPAWRDWAIEIAGGMERRFADGSGRYRAADIESPVGAVYDADDAATPSGESAALEFLARLSLRNANPVWRARAEGLRDRLSGAVGAQPQARVGSLLGSGILDGGETETARSIAQGNGRVSARLEGNVAQLEIELDDGWHVNSDRPNHPDLIATALTVVAGDIGAEVLYPAPVEADFGWMDGPLSLFESRFRIRAVWPSPPSGPVRLSLRIQPCSDRICLPPETHEFRLR